MGKLIKGLTEGEIKEIIYRELPHYIEKL